MHGREGDAAPMKEMTAADVMVTDVKTIPKDATLREAAQMLHLHNIGGAPVIDPTTGHMVGILSESDLLNAAKKRAALPHIAAFGLFLAPEDTVRRIYEDGATLLVEEIMTRHVITVTPDTPLQEIGDLFVKKKINRVPVVEDIDVIGIITRHDLLRGLFHLPD